MVKSYQYGMCRDALIIMNVLLKSCILFYYYCQSTKDKSTEKNSIMYKQVTLPAKHSF